MEANYPNIDWKFIIGTIRAEKCVLFLGPEIFKNAANQSIETQLSRYLDTGSNPDIQAFYPNDGLFRFASGTTKTRSYYRVKDFYQQRFTEAEQIFQKLARIPFHFIISITPDKNCFDVFEREGVNTDFNFYWKKHTSEPIVAQPSQKAPLIYNMFGAIEQQDSLVLTHDDLFDYFESIFQEKNMPEKLQLIIRNADNFIFLGLDFEKWYMQLLLRILYLHNERYEFMRYAANQQVSEDVKTLCFQQFKIEFVPARIQEFLDELSARCAQVGLLRPTGEPTRSMVERLRDGLEKDELDAVIEQFKTWLGKSGEKGQELRDDVILISNQHRRLVRKLTEGIVDGRDAELEKNKIRQSLLDLLNEAKTLENQPG